MWVREVERDEIVGRKEGQTEVREEREGGA